MPRKRKEKPGAAVPPIDPPMTLSLSPVLNTNRLPSPRKEISYLDGSLTVSNDIAAGDHLLETKNEYSDSEDFMDAEIRHFAAETDSILSVLCTTDKESTNAQLCLGNLRVCLHIDTDICHLHLTQNMQANLAHIIPQYVDDEIILLELLDLKERIDDTLDQYAPISEEARHALVG